MLPRLTGDHRHRKRRLGDGCKPRLSLPIEGTVQLDQSVMNSGLMNYKTFREKLPEGALAEILQPSLRNPKVRYRDLAVEDPDLRRRLLDAVDEVLRDGRMLMGPAVERMGAAHCRILRHPILYWCELRNRRHLLSVACS